MSTEKLLAGRYRIVEKVGSGGMAIVYRAEDTNTNRSVAVKILKPEFNEDEEFSQRFQREADTISQMTHHNIVNLLDVGYEDGRRYLVMEYVPGRTLKDLIREKGRMSPEVASQIAIRILAALKHAHQNGIIHRDIKPQNILVHEDGHIKVADFGIAVKMNSETLAKTDNVMGSVHYLSPEQASGKEIGVTSDIYSVGVVLYEMLTGRVPYDGDTVVAVAMQHLRGAAAPIQDIAPTVPKGLVYVVSKAMEKDPKNRYQSALDMAADIKSAMAGNLDKALEKTDKEKEKSNSGRIPPVKKAKARKRWRLRHPRLMRLIKTGLLTLTTLFVFGGLALGGISIYNLIINRTSAPDLIGMEEAAAVRAAQREKIKTEIIYAHHPTIAAGNVIMQTPEYDTPMHKGDTMVLTISKGPSTFTVPDITGKLSGDAVHELQKLGVMLTVVEKVISAEPVDTVLTQSPERGASVAMGETVQVTVSGGAVTVPNFAGMPEEQAAAAITAVGLTPGGKESLTTLDPDQVGTIASQKPTAGSQVVLGAAVTVSVYTAVRYQALITVKVPENTQGVQVKVTYLKDDGTEEEQYSAMHAATAASEFTVQVYGDAPGSAVYMVYLNGDFYESINAALE